MKRAWLELRYGSERAAVTIYRLSDERLLRAFGRKALAEAHRRAIEGEILDPVIGTLDRYEAEKLKALLDQIIPVDGNGNGAATSTR